MKLIIRNVRLSFPHIFTPQAIQEGTKPRFTASFLFPEKHEAVQQIRNVVLAVAKEKWGVKADSVMKVLTVKDKIVLKSGDIKEDMEGYDGMIYINTANPKRPVIVDRDMTALTEDDGKIYAGCYVNAEIKIWAMDDKDNGKGIFAKLCAVQFVRDGEAFGDDGKTSLTAVDDEEEEFSI